VKIQPAIFQSIVVACLLAMSVAAFFFFKYQNHQQTTTFNKHLIVTESRAILSTGLLTSPSMYFVMNKGQAGADAKFHTQAAGHTVLFCQDKVLFCRNESTGAANEIELSFAGTSSPAIIEGIRKKEGTAHYYKGSNTKSWQIDAPLFGSVVYRDLYPGIDMGYIGDDGVLETEFYLDPGADPHQIKLQYAGIKSKTIRHDGALVIETELGQFIEKTPIALQDIDGVIEDIEVRYIVDDNENIGFELGEYDHDNPLVIDPELIFLSTIGPGGVGPYGTDVALDSKGNLIIAGVANRFFPATDTIEASNHEDGFSNDGLLLKIDGQTGEVIWSALFGGKKFDNISGIAIDSMDNIYITGATSSDDFPTLNPFQANSGGDDDAFMAKLDSSGVLTYSTYLGGSEREWGEGIAIDRAGNVYIAGITFSDDFPVLNAFQMTHSKDADQDFPNDLFVAKVNSTGSKEYATYLGGIGNDRLGGIAVNASGEAVIAGSTSSPDFPVVNAFQDTYHGGSMYFERDITISKFNAAGNALIFSTFLGGSGGETSSGVEIGNNGDVAISGLTQSIDFPVVNGESHPQTDTTDGIIALLNSEGQPIYSIRSNIGGNDQFNSISMNPEGMPITIGAWGDTIRFYEKPLSGQLVNSFNFDAPGHTINGAFYSDPYIAFTGTYWEPYAPRSPEGSDRLLGYGNIMYKPLPPYDIGIASVTHPACSYFDNPFSLEVSVENQGSKSIDNYSVNVTINNMTNPMIPAINMSYNYSNLGAKRIVGHEILMEEHVNMTEYVGDWNVNVEGVVENDANTDNNTWNGTSKNIFTRAAIAEMVVEKTSDHENPNYATYLSFDPYPIGTELRPFGYPGLEYVFDHEAYFALHDSRELGRMQHSMQYIVYDLFGELQLDQMFDMPPTIDGDLMDSNPFIPDYLIDGSAFETITKTDPEEIILEEDGGSAEPSIDPEACLLLVSGEIINPLEDAAFERDINSLEQQFLEETNGHKFKPEQIIKLIKPTPEELEMKILEIKNSNPTNKKLYFIYSGHGYKEDNGGIGLKSSTYEEFEFYSYERLAKMLKETKAPRFTIIIDACFSGLARTQFQEEFWDIRTSTQELSIYTSAGDSVEANSTRMKHNGMRVYYSQYLFRWMQGYGAYDPNGDGLSSFEECHLYATWLPALNSVSVNYPEDEISLWRDQKPSSYKNGAFFVAEGDEKTRLGDSAIKIINSLKEDNAPRDPYGLANDVLVIYSEILGLPEEATGMAEGVEEVLDYRHWILDIETTSDSTVQVIFIEPDLDFGIEHSLEDPRELGVVYLDGSNWRAIPSNYNSENGEVQVRDFTNYGTIALAYTDSSVTTGIHDLGYSDPSFSIFPNPTNGPLNLIWENDSNEELTISVFNSAGIMVSQERIMGPSIGQTTALRNLRHLESGLYFVEIQSDHKSLGVVKIMRQ